METFLKSECSQVKLCILSSTCCWTTQGSIGKNDSETAREVYLGPRARAIVFSQVIWGLESFLPINPNTNTPIAVETKMLNCPSYFLQYIPELPAQSPR